VLKRSWAGEVRNVSLLAPIGVNESGYRESLGICEGGGQGGLECLPQASQRTRPQRCPADHLGCFPYAAWQRLLHWYRNIFSHGRSPKVWKIAAMLKAIHAREDIAAAREKAIRMIEKLKASRLIRDAGSSSSSQTTSVGTVSIGSGFLRRIDDRLSSSE
jgi:putative transposase